MDAGRWATETTREQAGVELVPDDAFEDFYRTQYPALAKMLYGMTGRWTVAEELAQEAMLAAHRDWSKVSGLARPGMWVRRVAINWAVSAHRRVLTEVALVARLRATPSAPPEHPAEDRAVWAAVRDLPRRQAAAFVLSAADGLTFDEIGEVLGCSGETARTHARRARDQLRLKLAKEDE